MTDALAVLWLVVVGIAVMYWSTRHTDRHFWKGAAMTMLFILGATLTWLALFQLMGLYR